MTEDQKLKIAIDSLRSIATLRDPGIEGCTAEGQYGRARIFAKIALRHLGVAEDRVGGSHGDRRFLHYKDLPPESS